MTTTAFAPPGTPLGDVDAAPGGVQPRFVAAHPFRIGTAGGIGRPTPQGAHRDDADLVAVILVALRRGGFEEPAVEPAVAR